MTQLDEFVHNLALFAPNKGQAKKTVSQGFIRLELTAHSQLEIRGLATDDVVSLYQRIEVEWDEATRIFPSKILEQSVEEGFIGYYLPDTLKSWESRDKMDYSPGYADKTYFQDFDDKFWKQHVMSSIFDMTPTIPTNFITVMPDRLRKFSLLEPRSFPVSWYFTEWADQTIIRWRYTDGIYGVYAPIDGG